MHCIPLRRRRGKTERSLLGLRSLASAALNVAVTATTSSNIDSLFIFSVCLLDTFRVRLKIASEHVCVAVASQPCSSLLLYDDH